MELLILAMVLVIAFGVYAYRQVRGSRDAEAWSRFDAGVAIMDQRRTMGIDDAVVTDSEISNITVAETNDGEYAGLPYTITLWHTPDGMVHAEGLVYRPTRDIESAETSVQYLDLGGWRSLELARTQAVLRLQRRLDGKG